MCSVSASNKKVICRTFFYAVNKIPSETKGFDRPTRLLPGSVGFFFFNVLMYDEFHVPNVLIVLLYK